MNIIDYIKWRGDLTLKQDPFNIVDNLVFSTLAYVDFEGIVINPITIENASKEYLKRLEKGQISNGEGFTSDSYLILKELANSKRFKDAILSNYVNKIDQTNTEQFSAITISLSDYTKFIAFRGTDDTVVGWKEDFEIAYKETNAQKEALKYLDNTIKMFNWYRVGGHSKGGNLALYASLKTRKKNNIISIYNNDGPGINEIQYDEKEFKKIGNKYFKVMPEFSIFGQIFNRIKNPIIIKSSESYVLQHSSMSWMIEGNKFVSGNKFDSLSLKIDEVLDNFLKNVDIEQRKIFVEDLFKAIESTEISKVDELAKKGIPVYLKILKELAKMSKPSKEASAILLNEIKNVSKDEISSKISKKTK